MEFANEDEVDFLEIYLDDKSKKICVTYMGKDFEFEMDALRSFILLQRQIQADKRIEKIRQHYHVNTK